MRAVLEFTLAAIGKCRVIVESEGEIVVSIGTRDNDWAPAPDHWRDTIKDEALRAAMWQSTQARDFACAAAQGVKSGRTSVAEAFVKLVNICVEGEA